MVVCSRISLPRLQDLCLSASKCTFSKCTTHTVPNEGSIDLRAWSEWCGYMQQNTLPPSVGSVSFCQQVYYQQVYHTRSTGECSPAVLLFVYNNGLLFIASPHYISLISYIDSLTILYCLIGCIGHGIPISPCSTHPFTLGLV